MLKNKLKSLQKEIQKVSQTKANEVYFVGIEGSEYSVKSSGNRMTFKGTKDEYEAFLERHDKSVFIVDDIPREVNGSNILNWIN
jgi:hypothetical protein